MATLPTILMIPSGYKSGYYGVVYNVLPQQNNKVFYYQQSGNGTRVNSSGVIETNGSNLPRLDYTNSSCPSLLLEPQSTNKSRFSEYFQYAPLTGAWSRTNVTASSSFSTAPDGANTSTKITRTSTAAATGVNSYVDITGGYVTETNTASVYVKNIDSTHLLFRMESGATTSSYIDAAFEFATKEFTLQSSSSFNLLNLKVDELGGEWYRVSMTYQNSGYNSNKFWLAPSNSADRNSVTANTSVELWGSQFEKLGYASSYMATYNNTVTRNLEICYSAGLGVEVNSSKSSFFIDVIPFDIDYTQGVVSITDSTISNHINIYFIPSLSQIQVTSSGGANVTIPNITNLNQRFKILITFENNSFKVYMNGILKGVDSSASYPTGLNNIRFADPTNNNDYRFKGNVYDLRFYKDVILGEAEAIELTSI